MCLTWPNIIADYSYSRPRNFVTGLCTVVLELFHEINYDSLLKQWVDCSVKPSCRRTVAPLYSADNTKTCDDDIKLWKKMESRELAVAVEQNMKAIDSYHDSYHDISLSNWKWSGHRRERSVTQDSLVLRWLHEYNTEFRSRFWQLN